MLAKDCSNFTVPFTPELLAAWKADGYGLLILQAFPPHYAQYAEQREQMRQSVAAGLPFDVYCYDYLGDPTWLDGALDGLSQAQDEEGHLPRQLWLDEEDVETERGWSAAQRVDAMASSFDRADAWTEPRGVERSGDYTAAWWHVPLTDNTTRFADRDLWDADYDNQADTTVSWTPYGGWSERRIKQFAGSQPDGTDLNVLSIAEEASLTPPDPAPDPTPDDPCLALQVAHDALVVTVADVCDRLGDQLLGEANFLKRPMRRWYVRSIVEQMQKEREAAIGPRP